MPETDTGPDTGPMPPVVLPPPDRHQTPDIGVHTFHAEVAIAGSISFGELHEVVVNGDTLSYAVCVRLPDGQLVQARDVSIMPRRGIIVLETT